MTKKKIVHIISSMGRGGRERQLATIVKYSLDIENQIICFNEKQNSYIDEYGLSSKVTYLKKKTNQFSRLRELFVIVKKEKPTAIYSWGGFEASFVIIVSLLLGITHINGSIRHGIVKVNFNQIWRLVLLHMSKYRVANSKEGLEANYINEGYVLYNGIDDMFFQNRRELKNHKVNKTSFISIANLVPYKDYYTILEALSKIKKEGFDFEYFIIGEGPKRNKIESDIKRLNLGENVVLLGSIQSVSKYLCLADVFIHSSKGEGCSNAILEAMACGLPIVATNTGGTKELVDKCNGFLFNYEDVKGLHQFLMKLIVDKKRSVQLGVCSKQKAMDTFSLHKMIDNYTIIINNIVNHHNTSI